VDHLPFINRVAYFVPIEAMLNYKDNAGTTICRYAKMGKLFSQWGEKYLLWLHVNSQDAV